MFNLPNTSKNKPQGNVMLFGVWGCPADPMLWEFMLNMDPRLGGRIGVPFSLFFFFSLLITVFMVINCYNVLLCR